MMRITKGKFVYHKLNKIPLNNHISYTVFHDLFNMDPGDTPKLWWIYFIKGDDALLEYATRDDRLAGRHMGGPMYFYTDWETGIVVDYNDVVGIELTQAIAEGVAEGLSIKEAYEIAMI